MSAVTLACPFCSVAVSFSAGQSVAQCSSCRTLLTNSTSTPMQPTAQTVAGSTGAALSTSFAPPSSSSASLVRCVGCSSVLSPPAGVSTFQCATCGTVMEQPAAPSLSNLPLSSVTTSVSVSPFLSTANSPLSSAPNSSTNSPTSQSTTLSSLPLSSVASKSPTPLSSLSASAFSTPLQSMTSLSASSPSIYNTSPASSPSASTSTSASPASVSSTSTGGSKKKRKDPQAPKRSANAYMVFCQEQRTALKEAEPTLAFGKLGKRLGEMWRNMTAEEKQPYEDRAGRDRGRYKQEMTKYQSEQMRQQMESHRMANIQQQQQRQQEQLIAAAQEQDLETRKRARIDLPLSWPDIKQEPMMMLGQMSQMAQTGQISQMGQLNQVGQIGQMGALGVGMQPSMLTSFNPMLGVQPLYTSAFDQRLTGLYQTSNASYPTNQLSSISLPSFISSGQTSMSPFTAPGTMSLPNAASSLSLPFTSSASQFTPVMSLASFPTSTAAPLR